MKLIIAGSRTINLAPSEMDAVVCRYVPVAIHEIVCGMARGVDRHAHAWAEPYQRSGIYKIAEFPADWKRHGKAAGPIRNKQMADYADALLAIWDGRSAGTKNMIETMRRLGKQVWVCDKFGEPLEVPA